eukprot:897284-Pyramimonas_sp.AAC.1
MSANTPVSTATTRLQQKGATKKYDSGGSKLCPARISISTSATPIAPSLSWVLVPSGDMGDLHIKHVSSPLTSICATQAPCRKWPQVPISRTIGFQANAALHIAKMAMVMTMMDDDMGPSWHVFGGLLEF